ncbi:hypothetical protein [Budvicia aquatica]|uniref:Bacterial Ig-like domain-containing protein n=1 Tax=Budvicia aquatica TaxID=82979 RepID=A0A484Z9X1_9GAMM|nr:hypothetical protein [Budvicia aquatica]VFS45242.1 Uncharacterised protein [Budvicia aquatica]
MTVNGKDYTASVNADGSWSVGVPAQDVAAFPEGQLAMTAQATDGSGNPVSHLHNVVVDLASVAISIDTIAGDNVLRRSRERSGFSADRFNPERGSRSGCDR